MSFENSFPKPPEGLMALLPQDQADLFQKSLDALEPAHRAILRCYLAQLSDTDWDDLIIKLTNPRPGHLRHYVNILGAYDPESSKPRQANGENKAQADPTVSGSSLSGIELRAGLERLPAELRHQTETALIESSLGQSFVFPDQRPGPNGLHEFQGEF